MNKKLLAVAVAGAFTAAPLAAFAQSTVTISGLFKISGEDISIRHYGGTAGIGQPGRPAGSRSNEGRLADDSSRIVFNVVEDLGGGMRAVVQADLRVNVVNQSSGLPPMSGNSHVGLRGTWGQIRAGQQDLHYGGRESYMTDKGDLRTDSISLLAYAGGGGQSIANATRTPNVVFYDTPDWSGFTARIAFSFSPLAAGASGLTSTPANPSTSADIGSTARKGRAWNLNPNYNRDALNLGYSYWNAKFDNPAVLSALGGADQRADRFYGSYLFPMGLRIGLAYDRSKLTANTFALNGAKISDRRVWSFPVSYAFGPHEIHFHYDRALNDKAAGNGVIAAGADTKARMVAVSYNYNLSKRTSVALNYAQIRNGAQATYNFFTSTSLGSADAGVRAGEDPRLLSLTMRHAF